MKDSRQCIQIDRGVGTEAAVRKTPAIEQHDRRQAVQYDADGSIACRAGADARSAAPGALALVLSGEPVVIGSACRTSPIEFCTATLDVAAVEHGDGSHGLGSDPATSASR